MKHNRLGSLIFVSCIFFSTALFAEYYSFTDSNGVKHFTDNLHEVPVDQRPNLNFYTTIQSPQKNIPVQEPEEKDKKENLINHESLLIKQEELKLKHDTLREKRDALEKQKPLLDKKTYNELVIQLNVEIEKYQEKLSNYETLVEQYNTQLGKADTLE